MNHLTEPSLTHLQLESRLEGCERREMEQRKGNGIEREDETEILMCEERQK